MSDVSVSMDFRPLIEYAEDKVLAAFGLDAASKAARERIRQVTSIALQNASTVQCIGMHTPLPIDQIYQPTRLVRIGQRKGVSQPISFGALIEAGDNAIVFGGPGRGKTVLLNYIFWHLAKQDQYAPILFTLRWPNALADLQQFVRDLASGKAARGLRKAPIILLVDGYDEVTPKQRDKVREALQLFASLSLGSFYLSCRTFYHVADIHAPHYDIAPFEREDSLGYIEAFAQAYKSDINAELLLRDLEEHGFSEFAAHPLMLAMICILKTGPLSELPRSSIRLIRRAVETLTFRWDYEKGVARRSELSIDAEEHARCMMSIAYNMRLLIADADEVTTLAAKHLQLIQRPVSDAPMLLQEIAQWYGMLVPITPFQWTFAHRTIHDYLAARYWVENGLFKPSRIQQWNSRAAYAACLTVDATESIVQALTTTRDIAPVVECLQNAAPFLTEPVAAAVVEHFRKFTETFSCDRSGKSASLHTEQDFWHLASDMLLESLLLAGLRNRGSADDLVIGMSLDELTARQIRPTPGVVNQLRLRYGDDFEFTIRRRGGQSRVIRPGRLKPQK